MNTGPTTIVHRGGFLAALAYGLFGLLITVVVCAAGIGIYGLNIVDRKVTQVFHVGQGIVQSLPEVTESLPPVLSDMLNDRRAPDYRENVTVDVQAVPHDYKEGMTRVVIEVTNNGPSIITLMALRTALLDDNGTPVRTTPTYIATPVMADHDWPGPIMAGSTRRTSILLSGVTPGLTPTAEIADLRVWRSVPPTSTLSDTD